MRIYFIRHGESQANVLKIISNHGSPYGLTEKGRQQVGALAQELAGTGQVFKIYSSPIQRAVQSAQILSSILKVPLVIAEPLEEYHCGILEGKSDAHSWEIHNQVRTDWAVYQRWESHIEGGESWLDIHKRFVPFLEELTSSENNPQAALLLVGHGGVFMSMLPTVLTNIDFDFAVQGGYPNAAYVLAESSPQGLVCLEWNGKKILPEQFQGQPGF